MKYLAITTVILASYLAAFNAMADTDKIIYNGEECIFTYQELYNSKDMGIVHSQFKPNLKDDHLMPFSVTEITLKAKGAKYYRFETFRDQDDGGNTMGWVETSKADVQKIVAEIGDSEYFNCEILVGGASEPEVALEKEWNRYAGSFNAEAEIAGDHNYFVFEFGNESVSEITARESREVRYSCGVEDVSEYIRVKTLSVDNFSGIYVTELVDEIALAIGIDNETMGGFSSVLWGLAPIAENISLVTSGGDCQGYWGHRYLVLESDHRRYTISIGGGE